MKPGTGALLFCLLAVGLAGAAPLDASEPWMPDGHTIAAHHRCGETNEIDKGPESITLVSGKAMPCEGPGEIRSIYADAERVAVQISGLRAESRYVFAVAWCEPDDQQRRQRVVLERGAGPLEILPPARAAAFYKDKPTSARILLPLPKSTSDGDAVTINIERTEGPDAVAYEFWLFERAQGTPQKRVLIVTGDDYPGHLWRETAAELAAILREDTRLEVSINESPAMLGSPLLPNYDAVVLHFKNYANRMPLGDVVQNGLRTYVENGGGVVLVHFGCGAFQEWPGFVDVAGRVWDPALRGHDPYGPFDVQVVDDTHAITSGTAAFRTEDELYTCLTGDTPIQVLCESTSKVDSKVYPMAFTVGETRGHVFHCTLGHDVNAFQAEGTRALYRRATAWAAGLE